MFDSFKDSVIFMWEDISKWILAHHSSIGAYFGKFILAIVIYFVISEYVKKYTDKTKEKLTDQVKQGHRGKYNKKVGKSFLGSFILILLRLLIDGIVVCVLIRQLKLLEVESLGLIVISFGVVILLMLQKFLGRHIQKLVRKLVALAKGEDVTVLNQKEVQLPNIDKYSTSGKFLDFLMKFCGNAIALMVAILLVFFGYRVVDKIMYSSGAEISSMAALPDFTIAAETGTTFVENNEAIKDIPIFTKGNVEVKSNGNMNIIYLDGYKVGVNIYTRRYKLFGVSTDQAIATASKKLTYKYESMENLVEGMYENDQNMQIYYNKKENDCLIIKSSGKNERVLSVTYYQDFSKACRDLDLD